MMRKLTLRLFAIFIFLFGFQNSQACTCLWIADDFCTTISTVAPHLIVRAKVVSYHNNNGSESMQIEVLESLHGIAAFSQYTVIGQDGLNCNQTMGGIFAQNDEVILGLFDWHNSNTVELNGCGRYFLHVEQGQVEGPVYPSVNNLSLANFKLGLAGCMTFSGIPPNLEASEPKIFPNPSNGKFTLSLYILHTYESYAIYDVLGNLMDEGELYPGTSEFIQNRRHFAAGCYFMRLKGREEERTLRVVIQ